MDELYYTYYQSPIGLIKIGGTEHYIAELSFIDKPEQMKHGEPGISEVMHQCTEQLIEFFSGKRKAFDIPVHQPGTFFQQKVWGELLQIPYGKTISYLELSRLIGDEKAYVLLPQPMEKIRSALLFLVIALLAAIKV